MKKLLAVVIALMTIVPVSAADVVYSWKNSEKKIALTFDDGPHPVHTPEILDILDEYGIRATFFVIGQNIEFWSDLVSREAEAGHEIGNHTFNHKNLKILDLPGIEKEICDTENAVYSCTGIRTKLLRPPEGKVGEELCKAAKNINYTVVCWSVDTRDWDHTPVDVIVNNVLSTAEGGDIILFHDFVAGDSPTPEALRKIIPVLLEEGYEFVTVSELIAGEE